MVSKKEMKDLRLVFNALFQIQNKGNTKPRYKNVKKKGFSQGKSNIKVFDKYILTPKGKQAINVLSTIL